MTTLGFVSAPEPVTEVPNSQPRGRGGPEGECAAGGGPLGVRFTLTCAPAPADTEPGRSIAAPLQPRALCLALPLLALLWI